MNDLTGIARDGGVEYRGVRYARAARFEPPQDVEGWHAVADGTRFGAQAPQSRGALDDMMETPELDSDEDCFFLNVFAPPASDRARPVLVFVHGGAFMTGSGAMPWYDGMGLVRRGGVVVVTINYRLGALGFLGDRNLGTLDQISALRWVRRHVADVGGDPDNVTIFGESAGGCAVVSLLAAPEATDLFARVWSMSPSLIQIRDAATAERMESLFVGAIDSDDGDGEQGDDLADVSVERILAAQQEVRAESWMQAFSPTSPGAGVTDPVLDVAAADPRPVVIGANRDEMLLFTAFDRSRADWGDDDVQRQFEQRFGDRADEAIEAYRTLRPGTDASALVSAMQTDETFRRPAQRFAESRARAENDGAGPVWMYTFDQPSTSFGGALGCCHGLDLPFAFDSLDAPGAEMFTGLGEDREAVAEMFSSALIAFAHDGEPGWPRFDLDRRATQRIGPFPGVVDDPEPDLRRLWD